jgi:hypothetical protein
MELIPDKPSSEAILKVCLFFQARDDGAFSEQLVSSLYGRYNVGGLLFVLTSSIRLFYTKQGEMYTHYEWPVQDSVDTARYEFLLIEANEEEASRLFATCCACARSRKPFNLLDLVLLFTPRVVDDLTVFEAPTLNCSQAIILILRECLDPGHPLRTVLAGLHSRQTLLVDLFGYVRPYALPVFLDSLRNLVKSDG